MIDEIKNRKLKEYKIEFVNEKDYLSFRSSPFTVVRDQPQYHQLTVGVPSESLNSLFAHLKSREVRFISEVPYNLEKHFKTILNQEKNNHVQ